MVAITNGGDYLVVTSTAAVPPPAGRIWKDNIVDFRPIEAVAANEGVEASITVLVRAPGDDEIHWRLSEIASVGATTSFASAQAVVTALLALL